MVTWSVSCSTAGGLTVSHCPSHPHPVLQEQYVFIHDALVEAVMSRDTSVTSDLLHTYVSELLTPGATGRTRMDKQFKVRLPPSGNSPPPPPPCRLFAQRCLCPGS